MRYTFFILVMTIIYTPTCYAQEKTLYKQVDTTELFLEVYYPSQVEEAKAYPALVFFFGGGWISGDRMHFIHHAEYFAQRGLVCFLVDYRTKNQNGTTPFESLKDAKSAMRFIRKNAERFHVDSTQIIASGGSAGGHLAAATALVEGYNDDGDDSSQSCIPDALVLFNPVIDNGPGGYGYGRIGEDYRFFSPLHNIKKGAPPTLIMLGTNDKLIPVVTAQYYQKVMDVVGSRCDLRLYEGGTHGFFNYGHGKFYEQTLMDVDSFLVSLGYLNK
ncbi:alpha/beta hydrolase [Reichenbachiella carrageenanivorans]|uniref:Alpha/beta hydrolase n=1 Tax=Reichenbachiella carrageenanivorans TaxID=2979869 RepID=A0ABY6D553_9BACT|nr:alpha/beta hydrolase [Reichenbachiella carrageenanivorans]UXX81024.1 alpha/beta hydrolase [Reichenbachiella carrageenanivorans]